MQISKVVSQNRKQLIIIQNINSELLKSLECENTDFLCIDIESMLKLKKIGLPFISFYDFYDRNDFLQDFKAKLDILKEIFKRLDAKYAPVINYPYAFMGNYYLFLHFFADIVFISEVIIGLKGKYQNVSLYTMYTEEDLESYQHNKRIDPFLPFSIIRNRKMLIADLLHKGLSANLIYSSPEDEGEKVNKFDFYVSVLKNSNYSILMSYGMDFFRNFRNKFLIKKGKDEKIIFCIEKYEPQYLLPYLNNYSFVYPIELIQKEKLIKEEYLPDFLELEIHAIKDLLTSKDNTFLDFLKIYQRDVISYIPSLIESIDLTINKYKPDCIFFSIGQVNILENIMAFLSNKNGIPIFNFQHGDGLEFIQNSLEFNKYIELNENFKKTLILRSKKQYDFLNKEKHLNTELFHGGSCKIFNYKNKFPVKTRKHIGNILVIIGQYPADAYKSLDYTEIDVDIFNKHNQMFKILKKYDLEVDIKLFPSNKYFNYFKEMLQQYKFMNSKTISQPNVELILPNYDLIIMDYIGSALTPLLMALDIPVIYWIDKSFINQNIYEDFCRRHYLITNETEFEDVIHQFKEKKLESKYDGDLVKEYCFPSSVTNPAQSIAEYIKIHILSSNSQTGI